jgi:hypothetical protein
VSPAPTRKHQKVAWRIVTFLDRAEAAGFGIGFVDADAATVQPYELGEHGYVAQPPLRADDYLGSPLFPGIATRVGDLFT